MENLTPHNQFNSNYLISFLTKAMNSDYRFVTLSEFVRLGCPPKNHFILRLDLDINPPTLKLFMDVCQKLDIPFTLFVRVLGPYNFLWYPNFKLISDAASNGHEIGLHTSYIEWANINKTLNKNPGILLEAELSMLRGFFNVNGIAPHRDVNYMFNSLPSINESWEQICSELNLKYHAYQSIIENNTTYINETLNPHLTWRNHTPEDVIPSNNSIYMLLHPHWWFIDNPFEMAI